MKKGDLVRIDHSPKYMGIVTDDYKDDNTCYVKILWFTSKSETNWIDYTKQNIEVISTCKFTGFSL